MSHSMKLRTKQRSSLNQGSRWILNQARQTPSLRKRSPISMNPLTKMINRERGSEERVISIQPLWKTNKSHLCLLIVAEKITVMKKRVRVTQLMSRLQSKIKGRRGSASKLISCSLCSMKILIYFVSGRTTRRKEEPMIRPSQDFYGSIEESQLKD